MSQYNASDMEMISVTIGATGKLSTVANAGGKRLAAIKMPAAWTAGTLTLYCSPTGTGSDGIQVIDGESGSAKTLTVTAGVWVEVPPEFGYSVRNVQLFSSVAQAEERTLNLYFREV